MPNVEGPSATLSQPLTERAAIRARRVRPLRRALSHFAGQWQLQAMAIAGVVFVAIFAYIPMVGILIAFQDYKLTDGVLGGTWIGFQHFQALFNDPFFWRSVQNTVVLSALSLIFVFPAPVAFALLLSEVPFKFFKRIVQTASYLPHFISYAVVASMWILLLDAKGMVNEILTWTQLVQNPIEFWAERDLYRPLVLMVSIWKGMGWGAIVYLAAIAGINPEIYEAAIVDGAGRLRRMFSITLPLLLPVVMILFILNIGSLFRGNLEQSILFSNPFNRSVSYVVEYYTLDMGLKLSRYSYATAISLFQSIAALILVLTTNWFSGRVTGSKLF